MSKTEKLKQYAADGSELVRFRIPGFSEDDALVCKVDRIGQLSIDKFTMRVVLAESQKKFDEMEAALRAQIATAYRNGMQDGFAAAESTAGALAEGAL
jgi:hypothetical protein